jgi:hypothetical protein
MGITAWKLEITNQLLQRINLFRGNGLMPGLKLWGISNFCLWVHAQTTVTRAWLISSKSRWQ